MSMRQPPATTSRPAAPPRASRLLAEQGLSLVEVTIMLIILLVLAGALIPVVNDSIASARFVRARNDLSQLAAAITGFSRDVGPFLFEGTRPRAAMTPQDVRVVDVLKSAGDLPTIADRVPVESLGAGFTVAPGVATGGQAIRPWIAISTFDAFDAHLRFNGRGYPESQSGPGSGWNGPYVGREVAADPWGHCYLANSGMLRGQPPRQGWCTRCAVYVISAGPNGILETPFEQPISNANVFGDDIAVRIQ